MGDTIDARELQAWQALGWADGILHTDSAPEDWYAPHETTFGPEVLAAYQRGLAGAPPPCPRCGDASGQLAFEEAEA